MSFDFSLPKPGTALLVIDVQDKLAAALPDDTRARTVKNAEILVRGMRVLGVPMLVTEQYPKGLGPTVAELRAALEGSGAIDKLEFDCSQAPGVVERLRTAGVTTVVLCGMEAHVCVLQTAVGLLGRGFKVWVAEDAVASRNEDNRRAALRLYERAGAVVAPSEAILFRLLGKAGTPEFKAISQLVK